MKAIDLTGQRFGRLTAVKETDKRDAAGGVGWECVCDCGSYLVVSTGSLRSGNTMSCGCRKRELTAKLGRSKRSKIEVGRRFGMLVVMSDSGKTTNLGKNNRRALWECVCDCGKVLLVNSISLKSGNTQSCGCAAVLAFRRSMMHLKENNLGEYFEGTQICKLRNPGKIWGQNKSGIRGVYWVKSREKWRACLGFKRHIYYLGDFKNIEDAAKIRKEAEERIFGGFLEWYDEYVKTTKNIIVNCS